MEGLTIKLKHNSKSYEKNNEQRVTRIEVDSHRYNEDEMYQQVTIDTYMTQHRKEQLTELFNQL